MRRHHGHERTKTPQILWPAQGAALERAEGPAARRAACRACAFPSAKPAPSPLDTACSRNPSPTFGSRSASAPASISPGRRSIIPISASSAASPSSMAWRACSGEIEARSSRPSASMTATRARCSPGCPRLRSGASSCCSPTPGRRSGIRSGGCSRQRRSAQLARVLRPGGELRFASDSGDYAGEALRASSRAAPFSLAGRARQGLAGEAAGLAGDALRTEGLGAGRNRPISASAVSDLKGANGMRALALLADAPRVAGSCALDQTQIQSRLLHRLREGDAARTPTTRPASPAPPTRPTALLNQEFTDAARRRQGRRQGHGREARRPARSAEGRAEEMDRVSRRHLAPSRTASPLAPRRPAASLLLHLRPKL